nr:MAG TPA: chromosome segregation ATPase [Caudoviricetes sp.]
MAKETVYNNTLVSGAADETLTYTRYVKDESSGKSTKELLDEKVNKTDQLGTTQIADKAVTTEKLENESVTTDKLNAASVTTDKVADANITTSKLADSSVETEKINNKAVTTDKLNDGAVDNTKLSPNAVTSEKIKNESIITEKLNDRAVTTEKVEEKAITNAKLGDQSVDGRVVREASLETKHFANESVTAEKVARKSITKDKLADNAVDASQVVDGSIGNAKLSPDSVTTEKIKDGSVTNEKIADNTICIVKFDPELRKTIQAATGLPDDLNQMIQDIDQSVKQLHEKDTDLQSQIEDKQQQITANDDDISLLQTRSTQMEEAIKGISASGGASQASAVTYENTESGLDSVTAQGAIDELANKNKSQDTEIAKKANSGDVDSQIQTEQERVNAELGKKFDKENIAQEFGDSENKVVSQFALPFREIESPEFIKAIVDAEDHFLLGIQLDGSIEWGKGIPSPIRAKLQEIISQCQQDKTDVLEAINTVKEELIASLQAYQQTTDASIAALQEGKVDKEEGKSLIEDEVKECFRIIENEEFLKAIVDSDDKVLFGFYRATGEPYYPLNEMYHVIQNEEYFAAWVTTDDKVALGIRRDGEIIGEIHAVNALKQVISQLQSDLASLQEKVGTIDSNLKELLDVFSLQENPEYLAVEKDADGKVLSATYNDGSHYIHNAKSETIPTEFEHIEDPEGRTEITTDGEYKVMSYRDADGKKHEHDMEITNLDVSNLNLQGNSVNNIQDALKANGFDVKHPIDLSDKKDIHIPIPNFAIINILSSVPREQITKKSGLGIVGKDCDVPVKMQFWDLNGNYFSKPITISAQGDSSMLMKIKNNAFDFTDGTSIKFGNWVSQDSFHLKKYYIDAFRGQAIVGYNLMEEIYKQHPVGNQKPFSYLLNQTTSMAGIGDISLDMNNAALCHPDGFPIIEYWNGEYGGVYTMALKKHRSNYNMNKNEARNIILDGTINNDTLFGGSIDWTAFEVKNPKDLYCVTTKEVSGWSYMSLDNTKDAEEIAQIGNSYTEVEDKPSDFDNDYIVKTYGDNPPKYLYRKSKDKYYKLIKLSGKVYVKYDGDNPKELIDSSMPYYDANNKDHIRTDAVKKSIMRLSQIKSVLVENKTKDKFEEYFNVPFFIDYFLHMQVCAHNNWSKNWIWVSYDGNIWCPTDYDNDSIFGQLSDGTSCWMPSSLIHSTKDNEGFSLTNFLYDLYSIDIESKYKELRNAKVFNAQEISGMMNNWVERIGYEQLKKEHEYCSKLECPVPSYRDEGTPLNWSIGGEGDGTLYSNNTTYNKNDVVLIRTPYYPDRKYTCQIDGTVGVYPTNYKNYPNFGGFYNSIYRVRKWVEERITKLDEIFKYNV